MTERGGRHGSRTIADFRVGPSSLQWRDGRLVIRFDELSLPWPGQQMLPERIVGTLTLDAGAITQTAHAIDSSGDHRWWPIAPTSRLHAAFEGGNIPDWSGHGYLDCNWGMTGLEDAFLRWDWARGVLPSGDTVILYDTERCDGSRDCLCLRINEAGEMSNFDMPPRHGLGPGLWRVRRGSHADAGYTPAIHKVLEDGPFYCRSEVETHLLGEDVVLMHESFDGRRFANPVVKAMLLFRMPRRR